MNGGRKKKVLINSSVLLTSEFVSIVCGLVLPRLILSRFGSEYNGIINSMSQFLGFMTLLRSGVGGVTRAALYKPLAENNIKSISGIMNATIRFMKKLAIIFAFICVGLAIIYPFFVTDFEWIFSFTLFIIIGISTFVQYYFGISYHMLLIADQRQYVYTLFNIGAIILNTFVGVILINGGFSIHVVKLGSSICFCLPPIATNLYVKHRYNLDKKEEANDIALKQRWDAMGHQIANYVFNSTDIAVLTFFSTVKEVSVYSVYYFGIKAIKTVIKTYSSSVEAAFGNILAKEQKKILNVSLELYECFMCLTTTILFCICIILIVPFVKIYTSGVYDANYIRPVFAILLIMGEWLYCLRIPYMSLIEAAGLYKQTKMGAYVEAVLNIVVSVILCIVFEPLIGVALGTLISMTIRTIEISYYADKNILFRTRKKFYRIIVFCSVKNLLSVLSMQVFNKVYVIDSVFEWFISAVFISIFVFITTLILALLFYRKETVEIATMCFKMFQKKSGAFGRGV